MRPRAKKAAERSSTKEKRRRSSRLPRTTSRGLFREPAQTQASVAPAARTSSIRRDARSTLDMTRETGLDLEQRLDLVALLAQLLELALQAALRQHPGARA